MNKDFSFYEFAGIITPSVIFLFLFDLIMKKTQDFSLFDFSNLGESIVFIVIAYGFGHILQSIGYYLEKPIWLLFNGKPTDWIVKKPRFSQKLFEENEVQEVVKKLQTEFGQLEGKNCGRLAFTKIFLEGKADRIEIFNGNYSLFRGMAVSFFMLTIVGVCLKLELWYLWFLVVFFVAIIRMIHFGKCYAREIYRTFISV